MIHSLYVEHGFKHHKVLWEFGEGLTAITGKNEAGKSLILEFIRYALFGAKALRGDAADYKKLLVELQFSVRGVRYHVKRAGSKVTLATGGKEVATGTKAVNAKIIETLGYGMLVFDVANACLQGAVEALGTMKPADRRKMVDDTVGLNLVDDLVAEVKEQATQARAHVEALSHLSPPVLPPEKVLTTSRDLLAKIRDKEAALTKANRLKGERTALDAVQAPPAAPVAPADYTSSKDLKPLVEAHRERVRLDRELANIPDVPKWSLVDLKAQEELHKLNDAWLAKKRVHDALPPEPELTTDKISWHRAILRDYIEFQRTQRLYEQGKIECPNCEHSFHPTVEAPSPWKGDPPKYTEAELAAMGQSWMKLINAESLPAAPAPPTLSLVEIRQQYAAHAAASRALTYIQQRDALPLPPPYIEQTYEEWRAYEAAATGQAAQAARYEEAKARLDMIKHELVQLGNAEGDLLRLRQDYTERCVWEAAKEAYTKQIATYDDSVALLAESKAKVADCKNAVAALTEVKTRIKMYLLPSLSKVASRLLQNMTGGARKLIEIDDAFDITVDGQKLTTLSGSAKAAANLSVRIGLGQVLTNKIFSVLLADEVDAAMDADRAGHTAESLRALTSEISQIILISHKRPEADAYVEV